MGDGLRLTWAGNGVVRNKHLRVRKVMKGSQSRSMAEKVGPPCAGSNVGRVGDPPYSKPAALAFQEDRGNGTEGADYPD
jgi:hypothetical protein